MGDNENSISNSTQHIQVCNRAYCLLKCLRDGLNPGSMQIVHLPQFNLILFTEAFSWSIVTFAHLCASIEFSLFNCVAQARYRRYSIPLVSHQAFADIPQALHSATSSRCSFLINKLPQFLLDGGIISCCVVNYHAPDY